MASSSGTSSGSPPPCSDVGDLRKRKRMQSNRESARRSRMRKQKHLDDLTAQIAHLSKENNQILNTVNATTQHFVKLEAENLVIRAQIIELSQRLQSLNQILNHTTATATAAVGSCIFEADDQLHEFAEGLLSSSWNLMQAANHHQPIMAAAQPQMFHY